MDLKIPLYFAVGAIVMASVTVTFPNVARAFEDWRNLYYDAKPIFDVRYRFEYVDQSGRPENAKANTVRARVGFESGSYYGIGVGFEYERVEALGKQKFNDTINGKAQFPVVADPPDSQINRLYIISRNTLPDTVFKAGRMRINWDNQRFIGAVNFRQNQQTFDAFRGLTSAVPDTVLEYDYLEEVHRIFGRDSPVGNLGLRGHGFRAHYTGFAPVSITPFALLLDFDSAAQASLDSQSYGVLLTGSQAYNENWRLIYSGSVAYQSDYEDNPDNFDLWYYNLEPGIAYRGFTAKLGYEVFEGTGSVAFQTPLATLHKFNGLTDQFLTTPPDGIEDLYLQIASPLPGKDWLSNLTVKAGYHQFWAENGSLDYGSEWNVGVFNKIKTKYGAFNLGLQYASYNADDFSSDTDKLWVTLSFKLGP